MNTRLKRPLWLGMLLAPMSAPTWFYLLMYSFDQGVPSDPLAAFYTFILVNIAGGPISYSISLVFGGPLYFLLCKFGLLSYWSLAFGGSVLGAITFMAMYCSTGSKEFLMLGIAGQQLIIGASLGFVVASCFYGIVKPEYE